MPGALVIATDLIVEIGGFLELTIGWHGVKDVGNRVKKLGQA